jgi:hypothetical protein
MLPSFGAKRFLYRKHAVLHFFVFMGVGYVLSLIDSYNKNNSSLQAAMPGISSPECVLTISSGGWICQVLPATILLSF